MQWIEFLTYHPTKTSHAPKKYCSNTSWCIMRKLWRYTMLCVKFNNYCCLEILQTNIEKMKPTSVIASLNIVENEIKCNTNL